VHIHFKGNKTEMSSLTDEELFEAVEKKRAIIAKRKLDEMSQAAEKRTRMLQELEELDSEIQSTEMSKSLSSSMQQSIMPSSSSSSTSSSSIGEAKEQPKLKNNMFSYYKNDGGDDTFVMIIYWITLLLTSTKKRL
jgi:hypothetical protein